MKTISILGALILLVVLTGCASMDVAKSEGEKNNSDGAVARGLVDSLRSPAHTMPANIPR